MEVSINGARILATFENVPVFGKVQITQTLAVAWLVMIIISALCLWLGSGLKVTGISRKQAVAEMVYNALVNFVRGNMGPEFETLYAFMQHDKKNQGGEINFTLLGGIGDIKLDCHLTKENVFDSLDFLREGA